MFDLKGKVAVVTGGIGLGMARGLAKAGARVVVGKWGRFIFSCDGRNCRISSEPF